MGNLFGLSNAANFVRLMLLFALIATPFSLIATPAALAQGSSANNLLIVNHNLDAVGTKQIIIVKNPSSTPFTLVDNKTNQPIPVVAVPNVGAPYYYFYLKKKQTARFTGYDSNPLSSQVALYCPADSSTNGQDPNNPNIVNQCTTSTGATFVEFSLAAASSDNCDISEVNGVNAIWSIDLPNGGWITGAWAAPSGNIIQVPHVENHPGASPTFYGDYGNPGVFPFGCSNCVSRYNNATAPATPPGNLAVPCTFTYPGQDLGCDNAINYYPNNGDSPWVSQPPPNGRYTAYENPPPGVHKLPYSRYFNSKTHLLAPANTQTSTGYGICQLSVSPNGNPAVPAGGTVTITLLRYGNQVAARSH
ncbi:MAG: hypothetical protein EKK48_08055 [Candidatus Melainabacteria bacterium]|nr:MAG: hypothetical protein EKK48_08055 [Candidatus Melainabacteria bacterium]